MAITVRGNISHIWCDGYRIKLHIQLDPDDRRRLNLKSYYCEPTIDRQTLREWGVHAEDLPGARVLLNFERGRQEMFTRPTLIKTSLPAEVRPTSTVRRIGLPLAGLGALGGAILSIRRWGKKKEKKE